MFGSSLADVSPLEPNLYNSLYFVYYRWLIEDINVAEVALPDMEELVHFTELNRNTLHRPQRTKKNNERSNHGHLFCLTGTYRLAYTSSQTIGTPISRTLIELHAAVRF